MSRGSGHKKLAAEVANTFEWLITAFILAFVFRAFVMEAYRIPTGSMADTLMGAHFRLSCPQCGYGFEYGFIPDEYGFAQDTVPFRPVMPVKTRCPSCGHYLAPDRALSVSNGDRILVLKCIYQFFEPKRWDVVVFKDPIDPTINYIKRLIGKPNETVEIIDGDIYIDGLIARKPPRVQSEHWMPVYNNDYQPVRPNEPTFNYHAWSQPFDVKHSQWKTDKSNGGGFLLESKPDQLQSLMYDCSVGNNFRATYAYNNVASYRSMPHCSDLMMRFYVRPSRPEGTIGISLSKYQTTYKAWVDFSGRMVIAKVSGSDEQILADKSISSPDISKSVIMEFANVDHQLVFRFGKERLYFDIGRSPDAAGPRKVNVEPQAGIFGSGKLAVSHVSLFRDIHYTKIGRSNSGRASEGNPFSLKKDEFFVLGDNSPNSADSRWWSRKGRGNNNITYPEGIVPREYMVGKALFVYWPGGFKPFANSRFALIPNIGRMRLIYNGSDSTILPEDEQ